MSSHGTTRPDRDIYSVSRLNRAVSGILEGSFPLIWVEGEISNLARPASGHLYFSLKDAQSQVRCAMFRSRSQKLAFTPENGSQVLVRARVGLYEARGEFQLVAETLEEAGDGALRRAFEALKNRLDQEGLFDPVHKQPLPVMARRIGVVTSATGAAIRDILSVLKRRFPAIEVMIYPVAVQGDNAAGEIAAAIATADQRHECDVLVVGRGGGSLEDLWAFNEEIVARAIYQCSLPVVSAVGHEIDFTIADFVADVRAPTPSAAAELLSPDSEELRGRMQALFRRLNSQQAQSLAGRQQQLGWLNRQLQQLHPGNRLNQQTQRLDELQQRLANGVQRHLRHQRARLQENQSHLKRHTPTQRLATLRAQQEILDSRLQYYMQRTMQGCRARTATLIRALDAISPLATLERGYAIVTRASDNHILHDSRQSHAGERIRARLGKGSLNCIVDSVEHTENE